MSHGARRASRENVGGMITALWRAREVTTACTPDCNTTRGQHHCDNHKHEHSTSMAIELMSGQADSKNARQSQKCWEDGAPSTPRQGQGRKKRERQVGRWWGWRTFGGEREA